VGLHGADEVGTVSGTEKVSATHSGASTSLLCNLVIPSLQALAQALPSMRELGLPCMSDQRFVDKCLEHAGSRLEEDSPEVWACSVGACALHSILIPCFLDPPHPSPDTLHPQQSPMPNKYLGKAMHHTAHAGPGQAGMGAFLLLHRAYTTVD